MASRLREDDKNEKIIRGLLKLPANRRCINCNNLGPQYVCTNFWTFICTNCSGIHREFCHRVKSISMAKFTSQEVSALQEGGNERAKEIYFKEWDPQRHSVPDSSNIDRLRDLIKHVYVDRRYTGERNTDRPMSMKPDDSNESRRGDSYRGDSRSPSYDDRLRERLATTGRKDEQIGRFVYGERSPGYDQGDKRDPRHFEVVDSRQRDDRFGNGNQRRFEDRRLPDLVRKPEGLSPNHQKDVSASSPPTVRPVRDILGDDMPQLHVGAPPKSNGIKAPGNPAQALKQTQRTSSSSSMGSSDGKSAQPKIVSEASLIDFSEDPEPSVAVTPQLPVPPTTFPQTISPPSNAGDWAAFDVASQQNVPRVSENASALGSPLTQFAAPASTSAVNIPISSVDSSSKINNGGQLSRIQHHQSSLFPAANSHTNNLTGSLNNQSWGAQVPQNSQGSLSSPIVHSSQVSGRIPQETSAVVSSQFHSVETKPSGREELPADIFTALYPSMPVSVSGWQRGPHPGMGYGMQYPFGMAMPTFPYAPKSMNPFDIGSEPAPSYVPSFPSMAPMQVALPNISGPSTLLQSSSFGNPPSQGVPQQQSAFLPGSYMMLQIPSNMSQQVPNNIITMGNQGSGKPSSEGTKFGNMGMDQLPASRYSSQPNNQNSFGSVGGNPFG